MFVATGRSRRLEQILKAADTPADHDATLPVVLFFAEASCIKNAQDYDVNHQLAPGPQILLFGKQMSD